MKIFQEVKFEKGNALFMENDYGTGRTMIYIGNEKSPCIDIPLDDLVRLNYILRQAEGNLSAELRLRKEEND